MNRLKKILTELYNGKKIKEFKLSLYDMQQLKTIYNKLLTDKEVEFINGNCFKVLKHCGLEPKIKGIGWIINI